MDVDLLNLKMIKNKTHRIISISPTGLKCSNKTTTPIKNVQYPTRSNTIKTNQGLDSSMVIDQTYKKIGNNENVMDSVCVTSYFEEEGQAGRKDRRDSKKKDEILHKIASKYDAEKAGNPSLELIKKTEINTLREVVSHAKRLIRRRENEKDQSKNTEGEQHKLEELFNCLKGQITETFSNIHKQLQTQQKQLCQELQLKIHELREKNNSKNLQQNFLKGYIQRCQSDINSNYDSIIKDLSLQKLKKIVDQYTKNINSYTAMLRTNYKLKLQIPDLVVEIKRFKIGFSILSQRQELDNIEEIRLQLMNKMPKSSVEKHTKNVRSAFEEVQSFPFHKIKVKKYAEDDEIRVSSARGNY